MHGLGSARWFAAQGRHPSKLAVRALLVVAFAFTLTGAGTDEPPWRARNRSDVRPNRLAALTIDAEDWGAEPASPGTIDVEQFALALQELCGWMPPQRPHQYTEWMTRYGGEFGIDPFLLGALTFRESRCQPSKQELDGIGLTLLAPRIYQGSIRSRVYRYQIRERDRWVERTLKLDRFPFTLGRMLQAEANLYFAAGLLSAWKVQHSSVDDAFEQVEHRHFVSHWVWGDRVRSSRAEDRILTDRRRLLQYYGTVALPPPIVWEGLELGAPLDGAPRVVSSGLGFARDGGDRSHRGVDVESVLGEPVRAIADGRIAFSGVDLPGRGHNENLPPVETNQYDRNVLGNGGRYVCIVHALPPDDPLRSCYMHLETVDVAAGDQVKRGQRIGAVGRTGMKRSSPHLHLELRRDQDLLDASEILRGHLVGTPQEQCTG